ncbi:helix-turn-helix transcriptional regulator [Nocardioides sp. YIM 152315]|uniref:helix-turn-helix transcriptional regulator n=1 Tax=Nocardioides sp. YIM 152315 TaxID=3031760 RepID=UPI0023DB9ABA|nr:helix-turn-helix transcriptional regulator [Nocardioides sp. YIM 152315]MDF1602040.1 AAA family ATPase [Nocardioides sp. YIM 152315]
MVSRGSASLHGRESERQLLGDLLQTATGGTSAVMVVQGDAGIGKSALLDSLEDEANGWRVLRASGVQSEMEIAFAGLHQLCGVLLPALPALPPPQAEALATAFGLAPGAPPDRFMVGLATLNLLTEDTDVQPLLCLIDDAQWLDQTSLQTLTFVARRLLAEQVVLVFATRPGENDSVWTGLPQLILSGLSAPDSAALLESVVPQSLDARVRNRILAESKGNPLALLELGRQSSATDLNFGIEPSRSQSVADRVERQFQAELGQLPEATQKLLLIAAADPLGDVGLLWRAAATLGVDPAAIEPAETSGVVDLHNGVQFRHPLMRSAAYQSAALAERQQVHQALADVTDALRDPDRRAWHHAQSTAAADEDVAAELETAADRAIVRGGLAAAAAFLTRAAFLSPAEDRRLDRELRAAETALAAGNIEEVLHLLDALDSAALDGLRGARFELLSAQIAFASARGGDALLLLLAAARRLEPLAPSMAADTFLAAVQAGLFAGRLAPEPGVVEVARVARSASMPDVPRRSDQMLLALSTLLVDGLEVAAPQLRRAYEPYLSDGVPVEESLRLLQVTTVSANYLWDLESSIAMSDRLVNLAREAGAVITLQLGLTAAAYARLFAGDLAIAAAHLDEAQELSTASGSPVHPYTAVAMAGFTGDLNEGAAFVRSAERAAEERGEGLVVCLCKWSLAMAYNGNGNYAEALAHCRALLFRNSEHVLMLAPFELAPNAWALAELVEAAVRCGDMAAAASAVDALAEIAAISGTDWSLGVAACARAQLSADEIAEEHFLEAIGYLGRSIARVDHARALLLFGEWLHKVGRRAAAREPLRQAYDSFVAMGVRAFAERAGRELSATGAEIVARVDESKHHVLSAQELHIARLAAAGRTNPEIGSELFLSKHTIEWHLRKVFAKLSITSRHELGDALGTALA